MNIRLISGEDVPVTLRHLIGAHSKLYWAVAWGSENPALAELMSHQRKIVKLVIGTHFYQTPPVFLELFRNVKGARVMPPDGAIFHPKTYLFVSEERSAVVIGSANFTKSAMEFNVETCCLIEGVSDEQLFSDIRNFITGRCWNNARAINDEFLRPYRIQYNAMKAARADLQKFVALKPLKPSAKCGDPLEMSWADFAQRVRKEEHFDMRLRVLEHARSLLTNVDKFSDLKLHERKAIAGTLGRNEENPGSLDWGCFGSMFGFGMLRMKINDNSQRISSAMDCIPLVGPVTQGDYNEFVKLYKKAFEHDSRKGDIASASRLLAMRRPDSFVCYSKANRRGLSAHFGVAASGVNLDSYWPSLIEPITLSSWWRAARPRGNEGKIWEGRAAFLDALFYDPADK